MKLLFLACLLGYAAASFLQEAAPAVDESVLAFLKGTYEVGSLREALGSDDPMFDDVEDDIKTELGKTLKEAIDGILEKIKDSVDHGKIVSEELLKKVKDIRQKLKDLGKDVGDKSKDVLKHIKEKSKELLKKLLERLGFGKRNLDQTMDSVARMQFREIVEKIREKILSDENIQKIRDYIKRLESNNEIVQKLKELVQKLRDAEIREILENLFEYRTGKNALAHSETWDKIKEFFKDLKVKITEHTKKFGEWVKDMWGKGIGHLKERYGTIKAIAMEFISHSKDVSAEVAREALEFFRPYKDDLGSLWNQIVDAVKEAIGKF